MTDMMTLDPYAFDQTDEGWVQLDKRGEYLKAAQLIEDYLLENKSLIEAMNKVSSQTIHFHAGQEYAMSGELHYAKAIEHFKQAFKENPSWDVYVTGSIAFLEKNLEMLKKTANELSTLSVNDHALQKNATLLHNFAAALVSGSYSYAEVYGI